MKMNSNSSHLWRIGEILLQHNWIEWEQLRNALMSQRESGERIGSILVHMGAVTKERVARAVAEQHQKPFVDLHILNAQTDAIHRIPKRFVHQYQIMPLLVSDRTLLVAVSDPLDSWVEAEIARIAKCSDIKTVIACADTIQEAILEVYGREGMAA
ncbi:MAG: hypothetical protein JW893_09720 [Candidatus Omnitrophica bacterium]|nr:hypothetical protein [Candidatus Omnitrophota bacterium]